MSISSKKYLSNTFILLIFLLLVSSIIFYLYSKQAKSELYETVWVSQLHQVGVGSPRLTDINNDNNLDIIIGSGFEWSNKGESAINAVDGKTGEIIWSQVMPESVYGTPLLIDINDDGISDVTVSGRFNDFLMVDGRNGEIIWSLAEQNSEFNFPDCNFNSPALLDDFDGDGVNDFVSIQGGLANGSNNLCIYNNKTGEKILCNYDLDIMLETFREYLKINNEVSYELKACRYDYCEIKYISRDLLENYTPEIVMTKLMPDQQGPGSIIYVISAKTGKIINRYEVPFGKESYSAPIYKVINGQRLLIYGSGGERIGGHLIGQNLDTGEVLWTIENKLKGFISSPLLYVEENDDFIVTTSMEGDLIKVNALTGEIIWKRSVGTEFESLSSVAIGTFKDKPYKDIVSFFSRGIWPSYESASLFIFDGKSGDVIFKEKVGYCTTGSSPIISDLDNDMKDDIVFVSCTDRKARIIALDNKFNTIISHPVSSGGFSTPIIMDIDGNKRLDIIVPRFHFIDRFEMDEIMSNYNNKWNQYRGKQWNGVYHN